MKTDIMDIPIYIWGTGNFAHSLVSKYKRMFDILNITGFIDNSLEKQRELFENRKVYSPDEVGEQEDERWIYIAVCEAESIKEQICNDFRGRYKIIDSEIWGCIYIYAEILTDYHDTMNDNIRRVITRLQDRIYGFNSYTESKTNGKKQLVFWHNDAMWDEEAEEYVLMDAYHDRIDNLEFVKNKIRKKVPYPFARGKECDDADDYITNLTECIIKSNIQALNIQFNVDFSFKQWRMWLFGPMHSILFDIYVKYKKLENFLGEEYYALGLDNVDLDMIDTLANIEDSYLYNAYRWSIVSRFLGIETKNVNFLVETDTRTEDKKIQKFTCQKENISNKEVISSFMENTHIENDINEKVEVLIGLTRLQNDVEDYCVTKGDGKIAKMNYIKMVQIQKDVLNEIKIDNVLRANVFEGNFAPENKFEQLAEFCFVHFLPKGLFEAFPLFYKIAYDYSQNWKPRKIYDALSSNMIIKMICCIHSINGTLICNMQHSAAYTFLRKIMEREIRVYDRFVAWGNIYGKKHDKVNVVSVCRYHIATKKIEKKKKILYMGNYIYTEYIDVGFVHEYAIEEEMNFIKMLPEDVRRRLVIRTGNTDTWCDLRLRCKKEYPDVKFESRFKPFEESVQESELVIVGYPGSPIFETILFNRPVIFLEATKLFTTDGYLFAKYKKKLEEYGLYYKDAESCANAFMNYGKLLNQLESEQTKKVYMEFVNEATNLDKDVAELWYSEFINEV